MDKESLEAKLVELKSQFDDLNKQIEEHNQVITERNQLAVNLREQSLVVKGEYSAIEKLIAELPVEGEIVKEGKSNAAS